MSGTILLTIQTKMTALSKTSQRLGRYVLSNSQDIPELSVSELAKRSQVSPAAVVRFSREIGLDGFKELKVELAKAANEIDIRLSKEISPTDSVDELTSKLAFRINHSINTTLNIFDDANIQMILQLIKGSKIIRVYGNGQSSIAAIDFLQRFTEVGKSVIYISNTNIMEQSVASADNSLVFLLSDSGENQETLNLAKIAKVNKATVVGITANKNSNLAKVADLYVSYDGVKTNEKINSIKTTSLMNQIFIVESLYVLYLQSESERI